MSFVTHLAVLCVLVVDLIFGAPMMERVGGRFAMLGFEFLLILGYILLVLQLGILGQQPKSDDR